MMYAIDTLRRIATDPIATAELWGPLVAPLVGMMFLLAFRAVYGGWPDFWRVRRRLLPLLADVGDGKYEDLDEAITAVELGETVPEKTRLALRDVEFAGVIDAPPSVVRQELREMDRVWPAWLASIQFEMQDGQKVYEVGSYAFRPEGIFGEWQTHIRLTPRDGGRKTALWPHRELNPWVRPVDHYDSVGWDADEGVRFVATMFASDDRYEASDRAVELIATRGYADNKDSFSAV